MSRFAGVLALSAVAALTACSDAELASLDQRLSALRDSPTGTVEPLPAVSDYRAVTYDQAGQRSPFLPERPEQQDATQGDDLAPDLTRPRDPLEAYPLDDLTMVGTLLIDGGRSALIRDPQGKVHRVYLGDHLGTDFGRIVAITEGSLQLVEIVTNGQRGWIERSRTLSLNNDDTGRRQG
ncbi:pilus assembly protein PilP [Halomonas sp. McH1-25]|uniref:pilus assembly protein PilP n=1 Tax=unclassified Halomonas TaxID=2609666 RepID=UPI001EF65BB3|nr:MULTISPECIES: pilus assembly protein PilP [unclassified Halomonas]MCG7601429.1 pilus assembly protein PilP [Halomonas sp. McH1-25]MCP1341970.1 pilus assembly protein PilP [Halomonas sp. FL8]MCP1362895.1 pilus assembly protein PilP [Halomonas sp. BBD45]MCP1363892.1 pilus assembly protein PilP [Halomonas sp. BBD48]